MGLRILIAAIVLSMATTAAAQDVDDGVPARIEGMAPWGTLRVAMEPDYPKALRERKAKAFVDIQGRVNQIGILEEVEYVAESEDARLMVQPMKDVIRFWQFRVPTDNECQPSRIVVKTRVWFDLEGEKPTMSIARLQDDRVVAAKAAMKPVHRIEPVYPRQMMGMGWQADVYTKVSVNPAGDVVSVTSKAYPEQRRVDLSRFEEEVNGTLAKWKFTPAPELTRNRHGCYEVVFRLRG